jgi:Ca-activated chloride channel family protein
LPQKSPSAPHCGHHLPLPWTIANRIVGIVMVCWEKPCGGTGFVVFAFVLLFGSAAARSAPDLSPPSPDPFVPETGMVLRHPGAASLLGIAPALRTDVAIAVSGIVARVTVRQTFRNPDNNWVEGVYGFPLPEDAAVDTLRMRIGDRTVEGEIRAREKAREEYDQARRAGKQASLIEQERPNIFTASVANIPPGGEIAVEIGYQQRLRYADGEVSLHFPSVVGPRYIPGNAAVAGIGGMGWAANTDMVPDAERITPPVRHPDDGPGNPLALTVRLDAGMPLAQLRSPSHDIQATEAGGVYTVALKSADEIANRDFVLDWRPDTGDAPFAALFTEEMNGETYLLAMVAAPIEEAADVPRVPREVVFIVDTSGSMAGESIAQAKTALRFALGRLQPGDRFNILRFSNDTTALFPSSQPVDPETLGRARHFVERLDAEGGTEIGGALRRVLDGRIGLPQLRQIVLVTDGDVGNDVALFSDIRRGIGDSRLFTVGIGSAPNSYFMRKAAQMGRGTFTHIGAVGQVAETTSRLFEKLERPALTQISALYDGETLPAMYPAPLPDLYHGEPVVLTARLPWTDGAIEFDGVRAAQPWHRVLDLAEARQGTGIVKLWARDRIAALMDGRHDGVDEDTIRDGVVQVALAHGLTSRYTSLVAVDKTPVRPADEAMDRRAVPVDLPAGWQYARVFGGRGATPATLHIVTGFATLFAGVLLLLVLRRRAA